MKQNNAVKNRPDFFDSLAKVISYLFIPPGVILILFIYLGFKLETETTTKFAVVGFSALFGFIIPVIFFIIQRVRNKIVDNDASDKNERTIPYLFGSFLCGCSILSITIIGGNWISVVVWIAYLSIVLVMIPINYFWKISAHTIGISIPVAAFLFVNNLEYLGALALIFLVGWARLRLKMHTFLQVLAGGILGFGMTYTILTILSERNF